MIRHKRALWWCIVFIASIALTWATWASSAIVSHERILSEVDAKTAMFEKWLDKVEKKLDDVISRVPPRR